MGNLAPEVGPVGDSRVTDHHVGEAGIGLHLPQFRRDIVAGWHGIVVDRLRQLALDLRLAWRSLQRPAKRRRCFLAPALSKIDRAQLRMDGRIAGVQRARPLEGARSRSVIAVSGGDLSQGNMGRCIPGMVCHDSPQLPGD